MKGVFRFEGQGNEIPGVIEWKEALKSDYFGVSPQATS